MSTQASDLARRLAEQAEIVCRHYLSNGRRVGRYWIVGDVRNSAEGDPCSCAYMALAPAARRRQMDRRGDRRARRSTRRDPG